MKTPKTLFFSAAIGTAFVVNVDARAASLAEAAAAASAYAHRQIPASPHDLEQFPWALCGKPPPAWMSESAPTTVNCPQDLATAAARAAAYVHQPIPASPHALEEFPWALCGAPPPQRHPIPDRAPYPQSLAAAAARASEFAGRPIAASPHALEEFPWALIGAEEPNLGKKFFEKGSSPKHRNEVAGEDLLSTFPCKMSQSF